MRERKRSWIFATAATLAAVALPLSAATAAAPETLVLEVEGMWDEGCETYIADVLLADLEGVERVEADHKAGSVTVRFDPDRATAEGIAGAIHRCSFFEVTGSPSHPLDLGEVERVGRSCRFHRGT